MGVLVYVRAADRDEIKGMFSNRNPLKTLSIT